MILFQFMIFPNSFCLILPRPSDKNHRGGGIANELDRHLQYSLRVITTRLLVHARYRYRRPRIQHSKTDIPHIKLGSEFL